MGGHKGDEKNKRLKKAVAKHFFITKSTAEDLVLKYFENKAINKLNLIEAGVNSIMA